MHMASKDIINRIIEHRHAPRIGHAFSKSSSDITMISACEFAAPANPELLEWGRHKSLTALVPQFDGEVRLDAFGNIYGRLDGKTKGECIKGALTDGWDGLDSFSLPEIDPKYFRFLVRNDFPSDDKYILAGLPFGVFSTLRDVRLMDNALTDVLLEKENVSLFLEKIVERTFRVIDGLSIAGCDAVIIYDDWGTQDRTFISPDSFRELFKPVYMRIADRLHENGMKFFLHSCGYNYVIIPDLIEAGIDVFQFDQPEIYGCELLAREFGSRVTFFSPVDVQTVLPTGDRELIERKTLEMVNAFKTICGGSLIVKDYPDYPDINVEEEWADWARNVVVANSAI